MIADGAKLSPRKPADSVDPAANGASHDGLDASRILIIDDTRAIHEDFRKILTGVQKVSLEEEDAALFGVEASHGPRATFKMDSAYQGNEGLALVQRAVKEGRCYSMAFVDVRMPPGWDGIETASRLWMADPDLQLVICTAYSDYSWDAIVKRLGNRDSLMILKKPFDVVEVLQLTHALTKKWQLTKQSESRFAELEARVDERTLELRAVNQRLLQDIAHRERAEARLAAFSNLSQRLSATKTAREAAEIIVQVADKLLGWDACSFSLYSAAEDKLREVLDIDTVNGQRSPSPLSNEEITPSALARRTIENGPQLISKENPAQMIPDGMPFGASGRPSASILYVPVRDASRVIGVLSIHSYTPDAYNRRCLETLQSLADHCGGALDRIRAEEALHTAQERLGHLLRQSPAIIYSFKTNGGISTPSWVSENVVQLVGYPSADCSHPVWWPAHVHPADWDRVSTERAEHSLQDEATLEYRLRHKNGEYRWVRDQRRRVSNADGTSAEVVGTWVDVTAQKELEAQLRQAQKMEAVGQLAGGVAHDFNNLLAVILGNTELVLMAAESELSEQNVQCLKHVTSASERATKLIRQLLAFSRKQILHSQPVNLNEVVGNLTKMLSRIITEDIELRCTYSPQLPLVQADVSMIEQVLVNLVVNARDAMPQGGQLRIHTEKHTFAGRCQAHPEARSGDFVCLSVTDTGTGIAVEHLPHLFEPFFTTKEVSKGSGLGLATIHGIIKQHQGWVEVSSQLQSGSTFFIYLPARGVAPAPESEKVSEAPLRGGSETILLVEDDEAVRSLTRHVLENFGYRVLVATSGREALDLWEAGTRDFNLLLTDIIMPQGVSGIELAEQLCAQRPGLKVIYMSGYGGDAVAEKGCMDGRLKHRLLQKPFRSQELIVTLRQCLDEQ
ncbi:MAG TPA: response regulator [Candidatus Baltobacteraceae bacterium]|nr:response regulator [Candidatus Baltobacteraceae bacterium]